VSPIIGDEADQLLHSHVINSCRANQWKLRHPKIGQKNFYRQVKTDAKHFMSIINKMAVLDWDIFQFTRNLQSEQRKKAMNPVKPSQKKAPITRHYVTTELVHRKFYRTLVEFQLRMQRPSKSMHGNSGWCKTL
jgi:hypothetical protein